MLIKDYHINKLSKIWTNRNLGVDKAHKRKMHYNVWYKLEAAGMKFSFSKVINP